MLLLGQEFLSLRNLNESAWRAFLFGGRTDSRYAEQRTSKGSDGAESG